jgi:FXSXX-COOH protein
LSDATVLPVDHETSAIPDISTVPLSDLIDDGDAALDRALKRLLDQRRLPRERYAAHGNLPRGDK